MYSIFAAYALSIAFFIIDISSATFMHKPILFSLLCFYIVLLFYSDARGPLLLSFALIGLQSFWLYGIFGLQWLYLIPLTLIGFRLAHQVYPSICYPMALLASAIALQTGLIEHILLAKSTSQGYTGIKICANIIVIGLMSLKYFTGKRGNRS